MITGLRMDWTVRRCGPRERPRSVSDTARTVSAVGIGPAGDGVEDGDEGAAGVRRTGGPSVAPKRSLVTLTGAYIADWNATHIYNPDWPPHAKFHNAQTMSTGAALSLLGLYLLWVHRGTWTRSLVQVIVVAASLYRITQLSAILYPGTALADGNWIPPIQPALATTMLLLNALAYFLERRRLQHRIAR